MSDLDNLLAALQSANIGDLEQFVKQANKMKRDQREAENQVYASHATDLVEAMLTGLDQRASDSSDWTGYSLNNVPVEIEGRKFTLSVTLTDIEGKAARKVARELEEAKAKVAGVDLTKTPQV